MASEQEKKAPLIETPKKPETRTQPILQKTLPLEKTASDIEDSSILDLSVEGLGSTSQPIVAVYIHSISEDIGDLLRRGKKGLSYIFRGLEVVDLKEEFLNTLKEKTIKPEKFQEIRGGVFQYNYHIAKGDDIYILAEHLNKGYTFLK